ncbi:hypothetical protein CYMTET_49340 [Cymbomonas tetramitiformis]|uniref:Uncharacterized protein n=1 Tax=Cymbomonas tetramitiformis TaxID=36881 RepID=A0AAE0EUM7_9CHLO|nr:hypothetical protein CYMTET_49340 [Cymbomonas tetramitiformis]
MLAATRTTKPEPPEREQVERRIQRVQADFQKAARAPVTTSVQRSEEPWELLCWITEMAAKTLLKDTTLRYQAFECLPEERHLVIAKAVAAGENVRWEQEGWEAMMAAQRSVLQERNTPHLLPGCPPSPEESDLVWYEHTKTLHPTLSAEDAWQLAVLNRSGAKGTNTAQPFGKGVKFSIFRATFVFGGAAEPTQQRTRQ